MEKHKHAFSLPKVLLFFGVTLMLVCSSHGWRPNQAHTLQDLLRAKSHRSSTISTSSVELASSDPVGGGSSEVGDMELDLIGSGLPGQPSGVTFKQYAGYVTVDESNGRRLFYYLAEATQDPSSKPLLLWLNGGPGCSSLGLGAMLEIGPFGVNPDNKTLYRRQHAWNEVANTLFVESPAGVGFSYSNTMSNYNASGDTRTAQDSYSFLVNWFKRFPHYKGRDFYIAGESYAGHYIPQLADIIIQRNMQKESSSVIKFKGVMIGNGVMNAVTDQRGVFDYVWSHALISDETHRGLLRYCSKEYSNETDSISKCVDFQINAGKEAGDIDFYNIYALTCTKASNSAKTKELVGFDPCAEEYIHVYLNLPHVQEALHANRTGLTYPWDFCSDLINSWRDSPSSMFPIYRRLISVGLHILLYSGDMDAVVPVTSTRYSIHALNLSVKKPWQPWEDDTGEVGGYQVVYEGLTMATVRGAGHEVPKYQPGRALALFKSFLAWD